MGISAIRYTAHGDCDGLSIQVPVLLIPSIDLCVTRPKEDIGSGRLVVYNQGPNVIQETFDQYKFKARNNDYAQESYFRSWPDVFDCKNMTDSKYLKKHKKYLRIGQNSRANIKISQKCVGKIQALYNSQKKLKLQMESLQSELNNIGIDLAEF